MSSLAIAILCVNLFVVSIASAVIADVFFALAATLFGERNTRANTAALEYCTAPAC
jgi:hypothetical protein